MHDDRALTRTRRYYAKSYSQCFTGVEAVTWLLKYAEADREGMRMRHGLSGAGSRAEAERALRSLAELGYIHHVTFEHVFQDAGFFYTWSGALHGWRTLQAGWLTLKDQASGMASWYVLRMRADGDTSSSELRLEKYNSHGYGLELDESESLDLNPKCTVSMVEGFVNEGSGLLAVPIKVKASPAIAIRPLD